MLIEMHRPPYKDTSNNLRFLNVYPRETEQPIPYYVMLFLVFSVGMSHKVLFGCAWDIIGVADHPSRGWGGSLSYLYHIVIF